MHAEPAADDHPGIGLAHQLQRDPIARVGLQALTDDRRAAAIGDEPAGARDPVAVGERVVDMLRRDAPRLHGR
jgi:hypothetical protein